MPGAAISENRGNCGTWRSNVGSRRLPCSELEYKARAPEKQASKGKNSKVLELKMIRFCQTLFKKITLKSIGLQSSFNLFQ